MHASQISRQSSEETGEVEKGRGEESGCRSIEVGSIKKFSQDDPSLPEKFEATPHFLVDKTYRSTLPGQPSGPLATHQHQNSAISLHRNTSRHIYVT
jgi:hypothetical protein